MSFNIGDVIVIRARVWPYKHYGVVVGYEVSGEPIVTDNSPSCMGIRFQSLNEYISESEVLQIIEADPAQGNFVLLRLDEVLHNTYSYVNFNCEHYANYLQKGQNYSRQTDLTGAALIGLITIILL